MVETQVKQVFNGITSLITENDPEHVRYVELMHTWHEIHMLEHIAKTKRDGAIIDIGANVGQHSVFFATHCTTGNVYSFEPNPDSFRLLMKNISDNGLKNVYPFLAAIGQRGKGWLNPSERSGTTGIQYDKETFPVIITPLLDYGKTDLIKIDVEGMEVETLLNCRAVIEKYRPEIYIETFDNFELITEHLSHFGYTMKGRFNNAPTYWFSV